MLGSVRLAGTGHPLPVSIVRAEVALLKFSLRIGGHYHF
jgi:hypothetical protein